MNFVFLLTGLAFVFGISWIFSNGRAQVRYKKIAVLFGLQLVISYLCLHTSGGISALTKVSHFFSWLMDQAAGGVDFVFGGPPCQGFSVAGKMDPDDERSKLVFIITLLILFGLGYEFYRMIDTRYVLGETYFQMVYFLIIFMFIIFEWQKSRMDVEKKKTQLEMNKLYYEAYDQLIMLIRERQHDMKNHINAILSLSYTTKNYDELIAKQEEYCGYVIQQNEKTKLVLSSGNPLIAGFLYSKIQQAESLHISMDYKMGIQKTETIIPEYELVEMSGILLDNAIEALSGMEDENFIKKIYFLMQETESGIKIISANTSPYYEEDLTAYFFEPGYSSKGANRGLGLSKLKRLVQNRKGTIMVYNELRDDLNYLTFEIELPK